LKKWLYEFVKYLKKYQFFEFHDFPEMIIICLSNKSMKGYMMARNISFTVIIFIVLVFLAAVYAFSSGDVDKALSTKQCQDCDFTGEDLSGTTLAEVDLSNANLSGANLTKTDLSSANLTGANLTEADLSNANLFGANLTNANLFKANLFGANLTGSNLTGAHLFGANFSNALWIDGTICGEGSIGKCKK
jgi:uncharacterized protein YjbI with pentapeptide repeats